MTYHDLHPEPPRRDWVSIALGMFAMAILVLMVLEFSGCNLAPQSYVEADRATYNRLAPLCQVWIAADSTLTVDEREILGILVRSWGYRVQRAEAAQQTEAKP